jgi:hypothetical protein
MGRTAAVSCTSIPDVPEPHRTAVCPTASEFQGYLWPTLVGYNLYRRVGAPAAWGMRWPILRATHWQEQPVDCAALLGVSTPPVLALQRDRKMNVLVVQSMSANRRPVRHSG